MKPPIKHIFAGIVTCFLFLNVRCSSTGNVTFLMPEPRDSLLSSSQTIIKGTVVDAVHTPDLTVGEQLQFGGTPGVPKNGYKQAFTIKVDLVVKGTYAGSVLHLHDLKDPKYPGMADPRLWLGPSQKVYVGWQKESGGTYEGLTIVNAEIVPATTR